VRRPAAPDAAGRAGANGRWGIAYSLAAYGMWGLFPIYFKAVAEVPAFQVLAHRIVWSLLFLAVVIGFGRRWREIAGALAQPRLMATLLLSATVIAVNWVVFIWAIAAGRLLECSLGYFINPLVSVLLGVVVLRERLVRMQWLAIALAATGVAYQVAAYGALPWVALALAASFGAYGLLRKTAAIDPIGGLFVEAALLTPGALAFLLYVAATGEGAFAAGDLRLDALLVLAGPLTALPLILFVAGARRIRLATVGLLQYIAPTGHLLLAVGVYGEPFSRSSLVTFGCIWAGLALYSAHVLRRGIVR
jgi:chloramphenicol-sensitive protein RarD